jgi:hypothetical protein
MFTGDIAYYYNTYDNAGSRNDTLFGAGGGVFIFIAGKKAGYLVK